MEIRYFIGSHIALRGTLLCLAQMSRLFSMGNVDQGKSDHSSMPVRKLRELPQSSDRDKDRLVPLIAETLHEGGSVLVFCGGRAQTQSGAGLVVDMLPSVAELDVPEEVILRRQVLIETLRSSLEADGNPPLERMILNGEQ